MAWSSVLIKIGREDEFKVRPDYFVYNAGSAAAANSSRRPPSLLLLPPSYHYLRNTSTGLLRHGEDDLVVVACLKIVVPQDQDETPDNKDKEDVAEMILLCKGKWWISRWRGITGIEREKLPYCTSSCSVVPVGDNMLCWVFKSSGLMFCNVLDERRVLRYVPLPDDPHCSANYSSSWNVCVTSGGNVVKFVNMYARCCCGGAGASECKHSKHCYVVKTWTLTMDSMTWVLDGMMDSTELWTHDSYKSLPCRQPGYPVAVLAS
nr:unnamed protein product [Digitaria exilis]